MQKIIIGLTGQFKSGKTEFSKFLQKQGFAYFSLADVVREEAKRRGVDPTQREKLQDIGNLLRQEFGNDILARRIKELIAKTDSSLIVIDSIRNPEEVRFLRQEFGAFIIGITAPKEDRLKRYLADSPEKGQIKVEEFERVDRRDLGLDEKEHGQHVGTCLEMADVIIENNGTIEELIRKGEEILREHLKFYGEGGPKRSKELE